MKRHYYIVIISSFLLNALIAGTFESGWNKFLGIGLGEGLSICGGFCYVPDKLEFVKSKIGVDSRTFTSFRLIKGQGIEFSSNNSTTIMYSYDFKLFSFTSYLYTIGDSDHKGTAFKQKNPILPKFGVSFPLKNGKDLEIYFSQTHSHSYLSLMYHF